MTLTDNQRSRPGLSGPPGPRGGPSCLGLEERWWGTQVRLTYHNTVQRQVRWLVKLGNTGVRDAVVILLVFMSSTQP